MCCDWSQPHCVNINRAKASDSALLWINYKAKPQSTSGSISYTSHVFVFPEVFKRAVSHLLTVCLCALSAKQIGSADSEKLPRPGHTSDQSRPHTHCSNAFYESATSVKRQPTLMSIKTAQVQPRVSPGSAQIQLMFGTPHIKLKTT